MPEEQEVEFTARWVFKGYRYRSPYGEELYAMWHELGPDGELIGEEKPFAHSAKFKRNILLSEGGVYRVKDAGNGRTQWVDSKPEFYWDGADRTQLWIMSNSARRDYEAARRATKDGKRNLLKENLEPIRHAYHSMTGPQKAQLIADVVRYITA